MKLLKQKKQSKKQPNETINLVCRLQKTGKQGYERTAGKKLSCRFVFNSDAYCGIWREYFQSIILTEMKGNWIKTNDYYNRDVVTCDVYSCKVSKRITIYVMDKPNFTFTVSAGAGSESSYTGCFYGHDEIKTVTDAIEAIEKKHKNYF